MGIHNTYRKDFPLLANSKTVYLDSAATALKPQVVIDAVTDYYTTYSANVFRGLYPLSAKATEAYEKSREEIASLVHATPEEIIFTSGTTESINLVAYSWGRLNIGRNDEILTSTMEHHSNFVPWQELAAENSAVLKVLAINGNGRLATEKAMRTSLQGLVTKKTKLVALAHVSNVLGTINPVQEIVTEVKRINPRCVVLIDGAQAVPHMTVNVADIGADFYAFSGHKMLGPTGIGVLWGRKELLERMSPFQFGGSMIETVSLQTTRYASSPTKFEAGTPHIAGAIGMATAARYMKKIGLATLQKHEMQVALYAVDKLQQIDGLELYGPTDMKHRTGVLSFNIRTKKGDIIHPHDVADILGRESICVRGGHHCAMPLTKALGIPASLRVSLHVYNTKSDIDQLIKGIRKAKKVFDS